MTEKPILFQSVWGTNGILLVNHCVGSNPDGSSCARMIMIKPGILEYCPNCGQKYKVASGEVYKKDTILCP